MELTQEQVVMLIDKINMLWPECGYKHKYEFYKAAEVKSGLYSFWKNGISKPSEKKLASTAKALGMSVDELLAGITEPLPIAEGPSKYVREFERITEGMPGKKVMLLLHMLEALATVEEISRFA